MCPELDAESNLDPVDWMWCQMQMANMERLSGCYPPLSKPVNRESKANIDSRKACTMYSAENKFLYVVW